jgi:small subunit ribosomal protein S20
VPITSSAKKALRQSDKRWARNVHQKNKMKDAVKEFRKLVQAGKKKDAIKALPAVFKALDKSAKKAKILKKNAASRLKSRLSKSLAKIKG